MVFRHLKVFEFFSYEMSVSCRIHSWYEISVIRWWVRSMTGTWGSEEVSTYQQPAIALIMIMNAHFMQYKDVFSNVLFVAVIQKCVLDFQYNRHFSCGDVSASIVK